MDNLVKHPIKVLAVDTYPVITKGIVSFLLTEQHIFVVDTAFNIGDSLILVKEWQPDIVIVDINLLWINLIEKFKQVYSGVKVIAFADQNPGDAICNPMINGANGFLLKNCSQNEMIEAVINVYNNDIYLSRGHASSFEFMLLSDNEGEYTSSYIKNSFNSLTKREQEVLLLLSKGFTNKEIATRLEIKNRTVEFHTSNILSKLGVSTRTQAVSVYFKKHRIILDSLLEQIR